MTGSLQGDLAFPVAQLSAGEQLSGPEPGLEKLFLTFYASSLTDCSGWFPPLGPSVRIDIVNKWAPIDAGAISLQCNVPWSYPVAGVEFVQDMDAGFYSDGGAAYPAESVLLASYGGVTLSSFNYDPATDGGFNQPGLNFTGCFDVTLPLDDGGSSELSGSFAYDGRYEPCP